jgi:hypothetical protein
MSFDEIILWNSIYFIALRFPQPTGIMNLAHVNSYVLNFQLTCGEITRSANIKLDTGCGADLVITKEIANALNLGDEDFVV